VPPGDAKAWQRRSVRWARIRERKATDGKSGRDYAVQEYRLVERSSGIRAGFDFLPQGKRIREQARRDTRRDLLFLFLGETAPERASERSRVMPSFRSKTPALVWPNDEAVTPDDIAFLVHPAVKRFQTQALGGVEIQLADDL